MLTARQSAHAPPPHHLPPHQQPSHLLITDYSKNTIISQLPYSIIDNNNNNTTTTSNTFAFGGDQPLFDFQPPHFDPSPAQSLMQTDRSHSSWLSNGQLTPTSTTRSRHHRESSLSSLGSAEPASPYTANTSNPHVAGEIYHDSNDFASAASKPLTPVHTPSREQFLTPNYSNYYNASNLGYTMANDGMQKPAGDAHLMSSPMFNNQSGRPLISTVASSESSTPPSYEDERQRNGEMPRVNCWLNDYLLFEDEAFRNSAPKLNRTMTDIYADELYNPNFIVTSAPPSQSTATTAIIPARNDVFSQRLQAANSQHLNPSTPLTIPTRERSPFRQGSPLAPSGNAFATQNARFGTASHMREQQKAEIDAQALRTQFQRTSPQQATPKTISPKDVDLVYHESEEDSRMPLFPPQQQQRNMPNYRPQPSLPQEASELDDAASQQSFNSMATSRRESSSNFSTVSQAQQPGTFNFAPPAVPGGMHQIPQQYPFVRREPSGLSDGFPATLTSMESSSSEYAPDSASEIKKPASTAADTGTYTCTYHGCTLRFDTPAKLQRHKREGHRNAAAGGVGGDAERGMTSVAQRNSQAGPHKCERINPSTGKPCNTIFSRPYDLTRHEDTIHNVRKQKVHCPLCTEEKTFSRHDALTRHLRVVHPEHVEQAKSRRGRGS